ncbi:RHO protein GDP dissociation inhibitor [Giardia duodenalis]|uniref:RHO protein GDP dissociation inhibitor n=1 Tax=Giardia intestinalis TaxID=5741 RepID=V6TCF1_GIAIN|nr:RHO protein GDP dissociation inhibitor [Giardia intestinalis]
MSTLTSHTVLCSEVAEMTETQASGGSTKQASSPIPIGAPISAEEAAKLWDESLCPELPPIAPGAGKVSICDLRLLSPDLMEPLVYSTSSITPEHTQKPLYTIKQGCLFSMGFSWRVSEAPIVGFRSLVRIYRLGIPVYKGRVFLGTFLPRSEPYIYFMSEECAPKGILAKGYFRAKLEFVDEHNTSFGSLEYLFNFSDNWG